MSAAQPLLSAVITTGAGTAVRPGSPGALILVTSSAGSSCTVLIQGSIDKADWHTLITLTDPAAAPNGSAYQGTAWPYMRANVSARASGTISATLTALDKDPGPWNSATAPSNTATAIACTSLTDSGLTATRVVFAGTGGLLDDDGALTWDDTLKAISATYHKGNFIGGTAAKLTDGAIAAVPATLFITKGSALGSSTVANPTATTHDGYRIRFVSTTAYAHVVSFNSGKINGGSNTTVTLTSGAIGDGFDIEAYQGVWYITSTRGTVTVS